MHVRAALTHRAHTGALRALVRSAGFAVALVLAAGLPVPAVSPAVETTSAGGPSATSTLTPAAMAESVVAITVGADRVGTGVAIGTQRVLTSTHVLRGASGGLARVFVGGDLVPFSVVATDPATNLALLQTASVLRVRIPIWGDSDGLVRGDAVYAVGVPSGERRTLVYTGTVRSPAIATGGDLILTDIPIDPLVEGGALVTGEGRLVGVIVAREFGAKKGELGWAVTSAAARRLIDRVARGELEERRVTRAINVRRWIIRLVLVVVLAAAVALGRWFSRWYRAMEARELAKEAEERAREGRGGTGVEH